MRLRDVATAALLAASACGPEPRKRVEAPRVAPVEAPPLDLVISGGRVVDGTGAPWFRADVGIVAGRIAAVGDLSRAATRRRIDVHDEVVAPGFIDMLGQSETNVLVDNRVESKIRQGITTEITGEGESVAPTDDALILEAKPYLDRFHLTVDWRDLAGYRRRFEANKSTINLGTYVGAGAVRGVVLGLGKVDPTPAQLAQMESVVDTAMRQGAFGLSSALIYAPDSYAKTPELVALARVAARHGGIYATHMRGEGDGEPAALDEVFAVAREANIPVEIFHLKVSGRNNWGKMKDVVARIERARAEGLDVTADMYPYAASSNGLAANLPAWAADGRYDKIVPRLHDPDTRKRIAAELWKTDGGSDPADILLVNCVTDGVKRYMGKRLSEVAKEMNRAPEDALLDLVEADHGMTGVVRFAMREDDVRLGLAQPWVSLGVDNAGQAIDGPFAHELAHPRGFGAAARILGHYARDERLFSVEEAVRKMTSLPARRLRLADRGLLRPGMAADLTVFDPAKVRDTATFEAPLQYAVGVDWVVINGKVVLDAGRLTEERPGRFLTR